MAANRTLLIIVMWEAVVGWFIIRGFVNINYKIMLNFPIVIVAYYDNVVGEKAFVTKFATTIGLTRHLIRSLFLRI
jgi:hypothetical protein